jgi:hypothetical protein
MIVPALLPAKGYTGDTIAKNLRGGIYDYGLGNHAAWHT